MSRPDHDWTRHHHGSFYICRRCGVSREVATRLKWTCDADRVHSGKQTKKTKKTGAHTMTRYTSHQAFVDEMVEQCLAVGIRERDEMVGHIRNQRAWHNSRSGESELLNMGTTTKTLRHKISLTTSRKTDGKRDVWCVKGQSRYVSLKRVRYLAEIDADDSLSDAAMEEYKASTADIVLIADKLFDEAMERFDARKQLLAVYDDATLTVLDLK